MLFTDVQRSVRLNKKKKSTNTSPYPDEVIDRLARAFYPAILACWNSEEGQREFAAWQAEQAHHANKKEIQEVPAGELPGVHIVLVCGLWQGASGWRTLFFSVGLTNNHCVALTSKDSSFLMTLIRIAAISYRCHFECLGVSDVIRL